MWQAMPKRRGWARPWPSTRIKSGCWLRASSRLETQWCLTKRKETGNIREGDLISGDAFLDGLKAWIVDHYRYRDTTIASQMNINGRDEARHARQRLLAHAFGHLRLLSAVRFQAIDTSLVTRPVLHDDHPSIESTSKREIDRPAQPVRSRKNRANTCAWQDSATQSARRT